MRFLSNTYDPKAPHADDYIARGHHETQAQAVARYRQWLEGKIIGEPKATETYSVEQLKAMNMVGVYAAE